MSPLLWHVRSSIRIADLLTTLWVSRWAVEALDLDSDPTSGLDPGRYLHKELRVAVQAEKGTNALMADELERFLRSAAGWCPSTMR